MPGGGTLAGGRGAVAEVAGEGRLGLVTLREGVLAGGGPFAARFPPCTSPHPVSPSVVASPASSSSRQRWKRRVEDGLRDGRTPSTC